MSNNLKSKFGSKLCDHPLNVILWWGLLVQHVIPRTAQFYDVMKKMTNQHDAAITMIVWFMPRLITLSPRKLNLFHTRILQQYPCSQLASSSRLDRDDAMYAITLF